MDWIFSYKDGSKELYHHGVKGMKWGQHIFSSDKVNDYYVNMTRDAYQLHKQATKNAKKLNKYEARLVKNLKLQDRSVQNATKRGVVANKVMARAARNEARAGRIKSEKQRTNALQKAQRAEARGKRLDASKYWNLYKSGVYQQRAERAQRKATVYKEKTIHYASMAKDIVNTMAKTMHENKAVVTAKPYPGMQDFVDSYLTKANKYKIVYADSK